MYGSRFGSCAQPDDVADSGTRQQGDGRGAGKIAAPASHQRLAAASARVWQTRFHLSNIPAGGICGRLFLARLPQTWDKTQKQPCVLAAEAGEE